MTRDLGSRKKAINRQESSKLGGKKASRYIVLTIFADCADGTHAVFEVIAVHAGAAVPFPGACACVAGRITPGGGTRTKRSDFRRISTPLISGGTSAECAVECEHGAVLTCGRISGPPRFPSAPPGSTQDCR